MTKTLMSAFGLAVALALTMPVIGATSADAAQMGPHHHHHHRHWVRHHHWHHHNWHRHHHIEKVMRKEVKKI